MNSFRYGNLRRVQPTLCHLIDFITVQHQVGCESVMLVKKDVLVLNGQKLVQGMTAAFKEYTSETLKKQKRESVRQKLEKVKEELSNHRQLKKEKKREQEPIR